MSTEQAHKRRSRVSLVIGVPIVLVVVYVLGVGPVTWLVGISDPSDQTIGLLYTLYAPLFWLHDNIAWAENFLDWYSELWEPY